MSDAAYRDYEVEVLLTMSAPSSRDAKESLRRSGLRPGELVGEALIDNVTLFCEDEGDEELV